MKIIKGGYEDGYFVLWVCDCHFSGLFMTQVHWGEDKKDPFQDVAIGGSHLPRQLPGYLAVWALTFCGKVSCKFFQ